MVGDQSHIGSQPPLAVPTPLDSIPCLIFLICSTLEQEKH